MTSLKGGVSSEGKVMMVSQRVELLWKSQKRSGGWPVVLGY